MRIAFTGAASKRCRRCGMWRMPDSFPEKPEFAGLSEWKNAQFAR
jgi:hypothetical protein